MNRPIEKEYVLGKIYGLADDIKDTPTIEPCEDAISRRDAIKEIRGWFQIIELNPDILIDNIKCLPSVAPSRPSGEWIDLKEGIYHYECTICHEHSDWKYDFCPNCGAKMKGE